MHCVLIRKGTIEEMASTEVCTALYDYDAKNDDELTFKESDRIEIISKEAEGKSEGWWLGRVEGQTQMGWFPPTFTDESLEIAFAEINLIDVIGEGAFGKVYRAVWRNEEVAVKVFPDFTCNNIDARDVKIHVTAKLMSSFRHRNIVGFYGVCFKVPNLCLVMEYARGGALFQVLRTHGRIAPLSVLLDWAIQIARGMNYLHNQAPLCVIHRNLKSGNILLLNKIEDGNFENVLKITGFELAREIHVGTTYTPTMLDGTILWLAPECIRSRQYSKASDVWSFGVVLWELLTGEVPHGDMESLPVAYGVVTNTLTLIIPSTCPDVFKELIKDCRQEDPQKRPSFQRILKNLEEISHSPFVQDELQPKEKELSSREDELRQIQMAQQSLKEREKELAQGEMLLLGSEQQNLGFEGGQKIDAPATVVPLEINLRGRLALEAYNKALTEGKTCVKRVPVMLVGQDHSGKTSLKNSLMGKPFNRDEDSTVGIDVDPSHFKVTTEIWKTGENDQAAQAVEAISYEHHAARLVAEHLKEEKNVLKSMKSDNIPLVDTASSDVHVSSEFAMLSSDVSRSSNSSRDATESVQASTVVPGFSSDPHQRREEHSPRALPKIPEAIASLIKKLLQEVEKVEDEEDIYSVLWDFGGQSVYYATHPLFITARAMYVLVYDLSRDPHERAKPVVKHGMYKKMLDNHDMKTNLDYLNFWMTSVASLARQDQQIRSGTVRMNIPPVFLVCTHADVPYDGADPSELAREVFGSLQTKSYKDQLYKDVFVVDNTTSGTESECSEVTRLREKVLDVARELPQMKEAIPIKWLKYEKALEGTVKEGHKWISFKMAKQIASEVCKIDDEKDFLPLLNFLHDRRIVVHFDDTPVLNDLVVLDPQWLVSVFKEVITVKPYNPEEIEYEELWNRLQSTGILEETLLEHVWGPLLDKQETSASLIEIMEKFSLLCEWPSSDASCGKQYLVPSVLMSHPPQFIIKLVASAQIPSLFLKFQFGQVPPGLFPRLVLQFFQWGQDEFWSSENPQLYRNFARFYTSGDEDCSVILWCHSSSIEIVVHREDRPDMAESLQSKLNISADAHYDAFEVACARVIRRQLGLMLECIRKEFCWLKNMKYEEGFICSVCCQEHVVKLCCDHHKEGCEQEECLHFWSVSDLCGAKQFVRCRKCAAAQSNKIHIKQFAPWIETADEQPTTDEDDGRLLAPEGGNDEKLLTLPSEALKSLFSQPCDSKEVVLQLTQCLQLDRASLEQPDPGTKRLIRCLATKAKQSNRLDVVKHLREITPAGTTGPLLPECLDIRNIPVRQVTDLTVELSGGEEWKLVAEELGLTPQEIRYLDKRIQNPCEAVLAYSAKNRYINVGCLYDKLNKCGLPMTADRL